MPTAAAAVRYLLSLPGEIRKRNFGLRRMRQLMDALGRPDRDPGIVHVAGTNGKGSTAAMIESGLRADGRTTGLYSSPHLSRINERFLLDGQPASDETLARAIEPVRRASERLVAEYGGGAHPTFFEFATAVSLVLFRQARVRHRIVETGLGGRLDASNVVLPELAVLTRVQCDHERYLGRDVASIAAEKAAIVKAGCTAVLGRQDPAALEVFLRRCTEVGAEAVEAEREWRIRGARSESGRWRFMACGRGREIDIRLALAGEHQVENGLAALTALDRLGIGASAIRSGLGSARWAGRLELLGGRPAVLLDAAHNPGGAEALASFLRREAAGRKVTLVYGSSRDKAVDEVAAWLFPLAERVIVTRSRVSRAASPEGLLRVVGHHHWRVGAARSLRQALEQAAAASRPEDWIVVAGSLFLVGEARDALG